MASGGGSILLSSEPFYDFSCSNCAKDNKHTEGECFCVECNETFCTSCLSFHNKIAIMRQHEFLDKSKMATRRPQQDLLLQPTSRCTVHPEQVINMYCGQHDLVCCTVCTAEDHRTCFGVTYIPKVAKNIKTSQEFQDVNAAFDTMRDDIEMLKKGTKLDLDRIAAHHQQIQASIKNIRAQINSHLDDLEKSIRDELERKYKNHKEQIYDTLAKLEGQLSKLENTNSKLKDGQIDSQLFVDMKEAKMKETKGRKLINEIEKSVGKPGLSFVSNSEMVNVLEIKAFGTLEDQKSFNSVSRYGDFNVKTLKDNKTCDISGSCQMADGNIVLTDMENEKLKVVDSSYKVIAECKLPGRPRNMCKTSPTEVAIALSKNKVVQFVEVTDKLTLKGSFSVSDKCRGIAYNEGLLYLACGGGKNDLGAGEVLVYDMKGKPIQNLLKYKHNQDLMPIPCSISLSESGTMLYIADLHNGIVTTNLDGTKTRKLTTSEIIDPTGICLLDNSDFIVCECSAESVILFSKDGLQKATLLSKADGIKEPFSVCYDRQYSRLIVSSVESNTIKVFNML